MLVCVPGSSANLGPGFDALALAVDRHYELSDEPLDGFAPVVAGDLVWTALGHTGAAFERLWFRSDLPVGRGMGSSAAAIVAGAYLGYRADGIDAIAARESAFSVAAEIEEHPDNAAASAFGGLNLAFLDRIHTDVPVIEDGQLFMWIPATVSLTSEARAQLPAHLTIDDVVGQAASSAAIYAGLLTGSWDLLQGAHGDRIHEDHRLESLPESRAVLTTLRDHGHVAWLSGSGPSVAALIESGGEQHAPGHEGEWLPLGVDVDGCVEVG